MLTIVRHCLVIFVSVNDFLSFFFFTEHFTKHINMLIVFFEREDVVSILFGRRIVRVSSIPHGPYCV